MKYAQLIRLLVGRELTLRYKRSVIGIGWTLLNPMLTSFVLWIVFSFVFASRLPSGQQFAPYLMAGILFSAFFNNGVLQSSDSIAGNSGVLTKIYVPPQIFALSSSIASMSNFLLGMIPLTLVVYISGQSVSIYFPLVFLVGVMLCFLVAGIGLSFSILFVRFDDARNVVNVLLMMLTYFTPIFYPVTILSPRLQEIVRLNPLTSYLNIYRWSFSNNSTIAVFDFIYAFSSSLVVFAFGIWVFQKYWPRTVAML
jgi:ABC-type polysaccharide/polyol phosphate export permease